MPLSKAKEGGGWIHVQARILIPIDGQVHFQVATSGYEGVEVSRRNLRLGKGAPWGG